LLLLGYSYGSLWFTYPGLVLTPGRQRLLIGITIRVHVGQFSLNRLYTHDSGSERKRLFTTVGFRIAGHTTACRK